MSKPLPTQIIGGGRAEVDRALPLGLYVHVPWCVAKCPYCDFNSHVLKQDLPADRFVAAVLADLDFELARRPTAGPLVSLFFGGGTPSLLPAAALARLLDGIGARVPAAEDAEVTLEANPGTLERGQFVEYAALGINRISVGVQSFDDPTLARLGRIHTGREAIAAAGELHAAGLTNFNLDLMYGLPGQTGPAGAADVSRAITLAPAHISYYELTIEPGTVFFRRPPGRPAEEVMARIEADGRRRLEAAGFARYEISAFARAGRRSIHNENYWRFGDYIGVGPGAHGKRSSGREIVRTARVRGPTAYLQRAGTAGAVLEEAVDGRRRAFEYLLNALRLTAGFPWAEFEARTGLPRLAIQRDLGTAAAEGLVEMVPGSVRPTARGLDCLNELLERFLGSERPLDRTG